MAWWDLISNTLRAGISTQAIIYALAAIGLNLHFGFTGLLNFGQVAFLAVGAYGVGIATGTYGWPLWAGILCGLLGGVVLGLLLGAPTLRLRADYLAIVTIATGEIVRLTARAARLTDITGGSSGINGFATEFQTWNPLTPSARYGFRLFDRINLEFTGGAVWSMLVGWMLVAVSVVVMWLLVSSPWGRVLKSIREDEDASRSLGKNVFRFKMQSLILGGTFGTLAGMFFAISQNSVQPDNYATQVTFLALTAAIMGGLGKVIGPVVGAVVLWTILAFSDNLLNQAISAGHIPTWIMSPFQVGSVRFMLVGLLLMLLMIFRPQGILGDKREIAIDVRR